MRTRADLRLNTSHSCRLGPPPSPKPAGHGPAGKRRHRVPLVKVPLSSIVVTLPTASVSRRRGGPLRQRGARRSAWPLQADEFDPGTDTTVCPLVGIEFAVTANSSSRGRGRCGIDASGEAPTGWSTFSGAKLETTTSSVVRSSVPANIAAIARVATPTIHQRGLVSPPPEPPTAAPPAGRIGGAKRSSTMY